MIYLLWNHAGIVSVQVAQVLYLHVLLIQVAQGSTFNSYCYGIYKMCQGHDKWVVVPLANFSFFAGDFTFFYLVILWVLVDLHWQKECPNKMFFKRWNAWVMPLLFGHHFCDSAATEDANGSTMSTQVVFSGSIFLLTKHHLNRRPSYRTIIRGKHHREWNAKAVSCLPRITSSCPDKFRLIALRDQTGD